MLEKIGMFKDKNESDRVRYIYKDNKGFIDITLESFSDTDYITVPCTYDLEGKNIVSVYHLYYALLDIVQGRSKNQLIVNVNKFQESSCDEFINELLVKMEDLREYYKFFSLKSDRKNNYLDTQFIKKVLHSKDYSKEEKDKFDEWMRKNIIYNLQRQDYISWDEYFMAISKLSAMRSKDPSTQVGACIVSEDNRLLSIGYNGAPNGFSDIKFPWDREGKTLNTKYPFVVHAERNAILNYRGSRQDFIGARIYVDLFPCNECAKEIIQSGISEVIYLSDKYADTESVIASKMLLDECGVKYRQLEEEYRKVLTIDLRK